jgi:hypothetical protein
MNLNELALKYKETKDNKYSGEILKLLAPQIKKKADYLFYRQHFVKCYTSGVIYDKTKKKAITGKIPIYTRLCDTHKIEYEDILQEVNLEILTQLNNYDGITPFEIFLFSYFWAWVPDCIINEEFKVSMNTESCYVDDIDEVRDICDRIAISPEIVRINKLFINLTEAETKLLELMINNPTEKQIELAEMQGVTKQAINDMLKTIRSKYIRA